MLKQTLTQLLAIYGPTSIENKVAQEICKMLDGVVDEMKVDVLGNLIAVKHGNGGKCVMLSAHMDHIGFIVTDATDEGFLRVSNVGGIHAAQSVGMHVSFENGVIGVIGVDGKATKPEMMHLFIDIGADSREEALSRVSIGDIAVYKYTLCELGEHRLSAPAMDDRAGCAILVETMKNLGETKNEVAAVFSVQEEVGLRGAKTAAFAVDPDFGVALDVTLTGDVPDAALRMAVKLGDGVAVKVMDRSVICAPVVRDALCKAAKDSNSKYQMEVLTAGGTDAGAIHLSRSGVPSGVLSIPCRYVHSGVETIDMRDMQAAVDTLVTYLKSDLG